MVDKPRNCPRESGDVSAKIRLQKFEPGPEQLGRFFMLFDHAREKNGVVGGTHTLGAQIDDDLLV